MFIRYHLIYYAFGLLIYICSLYLNNLLYILYIAYLFYIYKRFDYRYVFIVLIISFCVHIKPSHSFDYPSHIEGTITKVSNKYDYVKTQNYIIKLYNDYDFHFNDHVSLYIEYIDINKNSNDNAFNEELYLKGEKVEAKASLKSVINVKHRKTLYHFIEDRLSDNEIVQGYQRLFLLGERSQEIDEEYQVLSDLSLVHLFALSGMHITILYSLISGLIGLLFNKKTTQYLSYLIIGFYVFSIPFSLSLMRAFYTMLLYDILKKYLNKLDIYAILLILSLLYNPYYIYNISFIFSYFIYLIVLFTKELKNSFFYIYLSTLPIVLYLNYEFSILTVLSSDILNPFIEVFYTVNCLSVVFPFLEPILAICVNCLNHIVNFLDYVSFRFIVGKPNISFFVFYYIIYVLILFRKSQKRKVITHIGILASLVFSFGFFNHYKIYGQVTMIDVGQGDCTLIRLPMNKGNILIDTGGNKDYDIATSTIIPYLKSIGISKLDYVYISHNDYDHNGALESLISHFPVNHLIENYEKYRKVYNVEIEMINHSYFTDSNDNSLIMHIKMPSMTLLFMGDASVEVEKEIVEGEENLSSDIIKIGHHGSQTSTSALLLDKVKPKVAMIGVKKNNIYNHPSNQVIERLERKGIKILRTDIHGMFHIRYYDDKKYYIYE